MTYRNTQPVQCYICRRTVPPGGAWPVRDRWAHTVTCPPRANRYPGRCSWCGRDVAAGDGVWYPDSGVAHGACRVQQQMARLAGDIARERADTRWRGKR